MGRISEAAIERDRLASRERYRKAARARKRQILKAKKHRDELRLESRPFIGWDSEGYNFYISHANGEVQVGAQRTMLFGCSIPGRYISGIDLRTKEMLDLILAVERDFPDCFHVGFSFEYDVNQIIQDLPWRMLAVLKITGKVRWNGYRIKHTPHKMLRISKDGVCATIYDVFGFFHSSYLSALRKYHIGSEEQLNRIAEGKRARGTFTFADLETVVIPYWAEEIGLLPSLVDEIRTAAYAGGFRINEWHGPGALAAFAIKYNGVSAWMSRKLPAFVREAIRYAYAGGRFQAWRCGEYYGDIYTYDINSAYIYAASKLPRLDRGTWGRVNPHNIHTTGDISRFGLYHISYDNRDTSKRFRNDPARLSEPPYPFFHRDKNGTLRWPPVVEGWYWSPEACLVFQDPHARITEAIVFQDDHSYPFKWVNDSFTIRQHLQELGNPAEKAYKWALAAIYGAFARRVGWDQKRRKPPRTHELAWAGYITSYCRSMVQPGAYYAAKRQGLVSIDTDGITSLVPIPEDRLPNGIGPGLGQWKAEHFTGILHWQNGIYWLRDDNNEWVPAKTRGVPRGSIPLEVAQKAIREASFIRPFRAPRIHLTRTKYVGYRMALNGQHKRWRVWEHSPVDIIMGGSANGKSCHSPIACRECNYHEGKMHTISPLDVNLVTMKSGVVPSAHSSPHRLPWLEPNPDDIEIGEIESEAIFMDGDLL